MITLFILLPTIIAIFLAIFKRIKMCLITLVISLTLFLLIGYGLIPAILLNGLQMPVVNLSEPQWKIQNAIILLGAGTIKLPMTSEVIPTIMAYSRIHEAARLYIACLKNHKKCTVIISGGDAVHSGKSEAIVYRDALLNLKINDSDIELEPNSMNTFQNAKFTSAILKKYQFDQVILVTSGIHLKRSLLYFSYFGIDAKPALTDYIAPQFYLVPLGYNFALADFAIHEYLGIVRFHIYNYLDWNKHNI